MAERLMALVLPARGGSAFGGKTFNFLIMFYIYILKNQNTGRHYVGYTEDVEIRLKAHNCGKVRSTKAYKPYDLIYTEKYKNKTEARKRENFLKSGKGREFIKSLVN
jgi:putative endonuclease